MMKPLTITLIISTLLLGAAHAQTAAPHNRDMMTMAATQKTGAMESMDMVDGEVRKIDKDAKKITLKHGEIKNLEMPGMTMVFQVKDPALLDKTKVGDKVRFKAEKSGGAIIVTEIQPMK